MLGNSIFFLSLITAFISIVVVAILIMVKIDSYDGIYCYFDDRKWKEIPKILAQKYLALFRLTFGENLFGTRAYLNIAAFSFMLTSLIMILWRGLSINNLGLVLEQTFTGTFGIAVISWGVSSSLVAPLSLFVTSKLLYKSANSENHKTVYLNAIIDSGATYLLISLSIYFCVILTIPAISLYKQSWEEAFDFAKILSSFAHKNAITWPAHGVTSVSGVSARVVAVATLLPTIVFIFLVFLSFISVSIFNIITPTVVNKLDWLSRQNAAKLSVVISILVALITMFSSFIKPLELLGT